MRFEELNWQDIERYLQDDDRLMIVLGSCEQHGYLSLLTDVKVPLALADAASQRTGVLVAPPLNFGSSPYFLAYPGTVSLRLATLLDVMEDILRSVYRHGFRRILVMNGHGGNDAVRGRLYEIANELEDLRLVWYAWWQSHSVEAFTRQLEMKPAHANWLEAFSFTQVCELPEGKKSPPHIAGLLNASESRDAYGDGSFGGAYQAPPEIMQRLFDVALEDVVHYLQFEGA